MSNHNKESEKIDKSEITGDKNRRRTFFFFFVLRHETERIREESKQTNKVFTVQHARIVVSFETKSKS